MGSADTFGEAFAKAQLSAGHKLPQSGTLFMSMESCHQHPAAQLARKFAELGFSIAATHDTADHLEKAGLRVERVYKVKEGRPNVVDLIKRDQVQLVLDTTRGQEPWFDHKAVRQAAITHRIPTITTVAAAWAVAEGISALQRNELNVRSLQQWHQEENIYELLAYA
jgi:carbamoyl-phosphate synthase large subunit